jgi:hypothetical protein
MIYQRTPAGENVFKSQSDLPRKLRLILASINGRTDHLVYVQTLTNFGNVQEALLMLEELGLIENKSPTNQALSPPPLTEFNHANLSKLMPLDVSQLNTERNLQLTSCITQMSDFCTTYLPDRAMEILLNLESFSSLDAIRKYLPDYLSMVYAAGDPAMQHTKNLRNILDV